MIKLIKPGPVIVGDSGIGRNEVVDIIINRINDNTTLILPCIETEAISFIEKRKSSIHGSELILSDDVFQDLITKCVFEKDGLEVCDCDGNDCYNGYTKPLSGARWAAKLRKAGWTRLGSDWYCADCSRVKVDDTKQD
jgi:hypothetical protein